MAKNILDENIINLLGIASLPDEQKMEIVERMSEIVERRVVLRLAESLSKEDMDQLARIGEKSPEEAAAFLREKNPHIDDLVREEVEKAKKEAMGVAEVLEK